MLWDQSRGRCQLCRMSTWDYRHLPEEGYSLRDVVLCPSHQLTYMYVSLQLLKERVGVEGVLHMGAGQDEKTREFIAMAFMDECELSGIFL